MYIGQKIPVIGDFFRITFIENPGLAFGIDVDATIKLWISLFSLVASIGLIIYLYTIRNESFGFRIALALILGGAIGNFIDRAFYGVIYDYAPLFYGKVVDFLDFDFFHLTLFGKSYERFAIFNIADSSVTIGIFLLLFSYRNQEKKNSSKEIVNTDAGSDVTQIENISESIKINSDISPIANKDLTKDGGTDKGKETPL